MAHEPLLVLAAIGAVGVIAQWMAWRLKLPSILVLLLVGAVAGQSGALDPDELLGPLLFPVVSLAVALILFEGSLSLGRRELKAAGGPAVLLVTVGSAVTFGVLWFVATTVLDVDRGVAALIAANLIVTGPTVIGPLLQQVRPRGRVGAILRAEGIIIDPIGAAAAIVVFELISAGQEHGGALDTLGTLASIAVAGTLVAVVGAVIMVVSLERFWLPDHLRQPAVVATVLITFAVADHFAEESGLVAVTVLGLVMANQRRVDLDALLEFAETLQTLVLSCLFILLAARLDLDVVQDDLAGNLALLAASVFIARPLAVGLSTIKSDLSRRERIFLASVAPRGIVAAAIASVFAIRLDQAGIAGADRFAGAVITVLIGSIIVYGVGARWVGQRLQVAEPDRHGVLIVGTHEWAPALAEVLNKHGLRTLIVERDRAKAVTARFAGQDTVHGSILSARVREELDLEGIGLLLALSGDDELNALAVERARGLFGQKNTWQIPAADEEHQAGRALGWPDLDTITRRLATGARFRSTRLTEQFTADDYRERNPAATVVALIRDSILTLPVAGGDRLTPKVGDVVVALTREAKPAPAPQPAEPIPEDVP